jgi:ribonucleoside-diphosphate reductase alpha chain
MTTRTTETREPTRQTGLSIDRYFSREGEDPFYVKIGDGTLEYELRTTEVTEDRNGEPYVIFRQEGVEFPKEWSDTAVKTVAQKYFYGDQDKPGERESSSKQLIGRISDFVAKRGNDLGYFTSKDDAKIFGDELKTLLTNQYGAFNSPVNFNAGLYHTNEVKSDGKAYRINPKTGRPVKLGPGEEYKYPQASACFILGVDDTMESIMKTAVAEADLFKRGSGSGEDLSQLRSSREKLSGGGTPSGPKSFWKIFDTVAGVVQAGGKTRRAARMQSLKDYHPDIMEFIEAKPRQEQLAHYLIDSGVDGSFGGEAYGSVAFQNTNVSIRLSDEFMATLEKNGTWQTRRIKNPESTEGMPSYSASEIMDEIAKGTHMCGDPGVQYDTTINKWHTCKESGPINASNPCSEYMFLDDSACNLASVNLKKFLKSDGTFDTDAYQKTLETFLVAQEILVDSASYPTREIAQNSHDFRPLGLGYGNAGALLMSKGLAYDSEEGRTFMSGLTALMTGTAYATSKKLSQIKGAFSRHGENKDSMLEVMLMHESALDNIDESKLNPKDRKIKEAAKKQWEYVTRDDGIGFRNSQVTVLAPTGTIGFMMDYDTTGVEPDIALVKYKQLMGGGVMKLVNQSVSPALEQLGYSPEERINILNHIEETDTIEGAPGLKDEHLDVFDCAFKPIGGTRSIHYKGHIDMMASVQPFLSGAISKTVNMPKKASVDDIKEAYAYGHKVGLKSLAIYRDGSKKTQPLMLEKQNNDEKRERYALMIRDNDGEGFDTFDWKNPVGKKLLENILGDVVNSPGFGDITFPRRKMPTNRIAPAMKIRLGGDDAYAHFGLFEDGTFAELFFQTGGDGSTAGGLADLFATYLSLGRQRGEPVREIVSKLKRNRFPPSGILVQKQRGKLDEVMPQLSQMQRSLAAPIAEYLEKNFIDSETGKETSHTLCRNGVINFGALYEDSSGQLEEANTTEKTSEKNKEDQSKKDEKLSPEQKLEVLKKKYLEKADTTCKDCDGPAIKRGKCDCFCINEWIEKKGECGGA